MKPAECNKIHQQEQLIFCSLPTSIRSNRISLLLYSNLAESLKSNQASGSHASNGQKESQPSNKESHADDEFYSDIYFDSDDEKEDTTNTASTSSQQSKKPKRLLF